MAQTMFADCMLETSWPHRSRRSWTTLSSFGLQAVLIGLLLLLPILRNVALPAARTVSTPVTLGHVRQPESPIHPLRGGPAIPVRYVDPNQLLLPSHYPHAPISSGNEQAGIQAPDGFGGDEAGFPIGARDGLPLSLFSGTHPVMPAAPPKPTRAFRTSSMLQGSLIRRVDPVYPALARSARVQGSVVLFATISTAGTIENLRVLSGHPLLVGAAIDAVKQWRYRPYILNDEPIEVETEITVNFVLQD
jgi:periplasmic protein TonB